MQFALYILSLIITQKSSKFIIIYMKSHFVSIGKPTFHIKHEPKLFYFHAWLLIWHQLFNIGIVICATVCFDGLQVIDFWPGVTQRSGFIQWSLGFFFIHLHPSVYYFQLARRM